MLKRTLLMGVALGMLNAPTLAQMDDKAPDAQPAADEIKLPDLFVGDKAPELHISKWLKGEPVSGFEKGKIYVVEFWATWCGPCIRGMPHVSELQKEYKDQGVTVIGVNIWEREPDKVPAWMEERGNELMGYTVAMQDGTKMAEKWMEAAGQNGIPSAFIVNKDGMIAWIGHPMSMDEPLKKVVNGEWDVREARAKAIAEKRRELRAAPIEKAINDAWGAQDWDTVVKKMDELIALDPEQMAGVINSRFLVTVSNIGDAEAGYAFLKANKQHVWDNAQLLNSISWSILTAPQIEEGDRDLDLALAWADRACQITKYEDPAIIDTLAKAEFDKGLIAKAIEHQRKAVDLAPEGDMKDEFKERLEEYEAEMKVG